MYVFAVIQIRALIRLVVVATIQERRLFRSALARVRLLFESGVYSRAASIRYVTRSEKTDRFVIIQIVQYRPKALTRS